MATLNEKWIASPNYSTGRGPYNKAVLHMTEGATTIEALGSWFANPSAGCSSHHGADNLKRGLFGAYVAENNKAWTQGNANSYCLSIELCAPSGASANWSRDYWLNNQDTLLRNAAEWVAYVCGKYSIPIVALSNAQAQDPNVRGVCQHVNLGSWGSGHVDCGSGFPMDVVLQWAKDGSPSSSTGGSTLMASSAFDSSGQSHFACIWSDGKVNYKGPGGSWTAVDPGQSGAKGEADISIDTGNDHIMITYINQAGAVCTYEKYRNDNSWGWANRGGSTGLTEPSPPAAFTTLKGADYSWDHPDLNCLSGQGVKFLMRYGSRDPSKNLTSGELSSIRAAGLKVGVVWQEGKTQMLRGFSGGQTDARDADAFVKALGLDGIPIYYSCDFDPGSADWSKVDAYLDGTISVTGLARNGMYGGKSAVTREFDRGKIKYGWQTYAWSGSPTQWDARAQLRQVKNDQTVCGGKIDWDEQRVSDAGLR